MGKGGNMDRTEVYATNSFYWDTKGNDFLRAIVLPKYGSFISEEKWHLFGNVSGTKMLEIGCGNGQSLQYHGGRGAAELWGIDISEKQVDRARQHLTSCGFSAKLICSPLTLFIPYMPLGGPPILRALSVGSPRI
ncbi:hypothetical protein HMSSN139_31320 [Paenibacillus sp. HMSSN-139]|nr:hypothetical protein HMSSN139_31320 [Paenibacillus sp. HMSSN-139]